MGAQTSHTTSGASEIISKTSHSSACSSLTVPLWSETSYAESFSTSISECEILSAPNEKAFSFNGLKNANRSFSFDSFLREGGFGSSAHSSLTIRTGSETSYAESLPTSMSEGEILSPNKEEDLVLGEGGFGSPVHSSLTVRTWSETSHTESLSTSISECEMLSPPNEKAFSFNGLKNANRSFSFDSFLRKGGFGSSAHSSLTIRTGSETSYAESLPTSMSEGEILSPNKEEDLVLGEGGFGSPAHSSLTVRTWSETSHIESLSTSISEREILSLPDEKTFSLNGPKNANRSLSFDSFLGEVGFGSLASVTVRSWIERSYAESFSTSIAECEILSAPNEKAFNRSLSFDSLLGEGGFGSSACSSLAIRTGSETSYAESLPSSIFEGEILSYPNPKAFSFDELNKVTRNFHLDTLLGEGESGIVFKGWIDEQTLATTNPGSRMIVAVKKLKPEGFQGHKEWLTEVNYLGQIHHPNLVKLIGYCLDGENRLLVSEFMSKGSLENLLFRNGSQPLSWEVRIKVAIGAAGGLSFLHDAKSQVINCNFKASNILLDAEFNVKLSDFGLAKAGPTGDCPFVGIMGLNCNCPGDCAHWMLFEGPYGYVEPEYVATGPKGDVYRFGVVLLELLSGRRAFDRSRVFGEQNLVKWAKPYLGNEHKLFQIMDTKLEGQYPEKGVYIAATLALQCLSTEATFRPQMIEVLETLEHVQALKVVANHSNQKSRQFPILSESPQ